MDSGNDSSTIFSQKLNGSNYIVWKHQIRMYMKGRGLLDNLDGKVPASDGSAEVKSQYERNDGKAMFALSQSIDGRHASMIVSCKTAKDIVDKFASSYEKNSEIRVMTLYEEYFALKMKEDERIVDYLSKVHRIVDEIEQQEEELSERLKMVRIIGSLSSKFNNFRTVWYNTKDSRTLDTLASALQLEEDNLNRIQTQDSAPSEQVAFIAKSQNKSRSPYKSKPKVNVNDIKKKTRCHSCKEIGHWAKECPNKKSLSGYKKNDKGKNESAWCGVVDAANKVDNDIWFADSGASSHMTNRCDWFHELHVYKGKKIVEIADNNRLEIHGIGTILIESRVNNQWEPVRLENVLYVPDLSKNLLSTAALTDKDLNVIINKNGIKVLDKNNKVVAIGSRNSKNQLIMDIRLRIKEYANVATVSLQHWHRRLGHINVDSIKKMYKDGLVDGMNLSGSDKFFCEECQLGKMTRSNHKMSTKRSSVRGEYMHIDLCGPMEETGIGGYRFFMLIKDEATSFRFIYLLKTKDEVFDCLSSFIAMVENMNGANIKYFRFDNGTEFVNKKVTNLLSKHGIQRENIVAYTPEQNGRIERENRTIVECARTMLIESELPKCLWSEAVRTAAYILNRSTNSNCVGSTPYEKWFDRKPFLGHVKIFGTECFVNIPKQHRKKWDPKARKVFLVGYEPTIKNFRLYDPVGHKILINCDIRFNELESKSCVINEFNKDFDEIIDKKEFEDDQEKESLDMGDTSLVFQDAIEGDVSISNEEMSNEKEDNHEKQLTNKRYNLRPKVKVQDRLIESGLIAAIIEPKTYDEAISSKECEQWKYAMDDEYNSLVNNDTWQLVEAPENQKVIDNRWVYKVKYLEDGSVDRFKARLVIRGFTQQYGINYEETFSPVVKFTSIRAILSLAAMNNMQMKQFDIKTAFLNGDLKENVYMKQPFGYDDNSGKVCKLVKSLYGLKQASRCWNQKFTSFIRKFDFKVCESDPCVFIKIKTGGLTIIAIYVDDGLIVSNDNSEIKSVISYLKKHLEVKDFEAKCFLGLQIEKLSNGSIKVHQEAYVNKIVNRFNMSECKSVCTPVDCNQNLGDFINEENNISFPYREAVGSLMYLSVGTRPDISYAVGVVSRYLERPNQVHVNAVKRIFKYIKGTANMGIVYKNKDNFDFVGYSDADYAADNETRRSTSGYAFHLGSGVVSWASMRQQSVSTSTTESEYIAACQGVKELIWLKHLVVELKPDQIIKAKFFMDNQSAIKLIKNPVFHKRTKHIDVQYHFIREKFEEKEFELEYVNTDEQIADILTKALIGKRHKYLTNLLGLSV